MRTNRPSNLYMLERIQVTIEIELLRESKRRMLEEVKEASEQMRKVKSSC
jgi:hypothetical protein